MVGTPSASVSEIAVRIIKLLRAATAPSVVWLSQSEAIVCMKAANNRRGHQSPTIANALAMVLSV